MRRVLIASCLLLAPITAACSGGNAADPGVTTFGPDDGSGVFASALLEGTLEIDEGCVVLRDDSGRRHVLAFADDTATFSDEVLSYRGQDIVPGEEIAAGGGGTSEATDVALAPECDQDLPVWRVDPNTDLAAPAD